jgi:L-aspartate oxidase
VHGANRLAYNSLLEGLVFGARVAHDVLSRPWPDDHSKVEVPSESLDLPVVAGPVVEELRQVMWDRAGVIRTGDGLWQARSTLIDMEPVLRRTISGRNAADLALLVVMAALRRSESRGGHFRADYPEPDPKQAMRALVVPGAVPTVAVG